MSISIVSPTAATTPSPNIVVRRLVDSVTTSHTAMQSNPPYFCNNEWVFVNNSIQMSINMRPLNHPKYCQEIYSINQLKMQRSFTNGLLQRNLNKLEEFSGFQQNWNAYGAQPIPAHIIQNAKNLLHAVSVQPEVFPTAAESIQFEFERSDGSYLELELRNNSVNVYSVSTDGFESEYNEDYNVYRIQEIVESFYGKRHYTV